MGHALLFAIIEPNSTDLEAIKKQVEDLLEPFDQESTTVERESVVISCYCTEDDSKEADSACEECGGTGETLMEINPQEAFDWYGFGGCWDGCIQGKCADLPQGTPPYDGLGGNMALVRDIPGDLHPWAILTPDGEWHGGGGNEEKDAAQWAIEEAALLSRFPDHLAIAVDFHY